MSHRPLREIAARQKMWQRYQEQYQHIPLTSKLVQEWSNIIDALAACYAVNVLGLDEAVKLCYDYGMVLWDEQKQMERPSLV